MMIQTITQVIIVYIIMVLLSTVITGVTLKKLFNNVNKGFLYTDGSGEHEKGDYLIMLFTKPVMPLQFVPFVNIIICLAISIGYTAFENIIIGNMLNEGTVIRKR